MSDTISITPAANQYLNKQLIKKGAKHIRLSIKEVGCSGMAYVIDYTDTKQETDLVFMGDGFKVYVSPKDLEVLKGVEVDFVKRGINAMIEFKNPNATGTCGCGESFTINK